MIRINYRSLISSEGFYFILLLPTLLSFSVLLNDIWQDQERYVPLDYGRYHTEVVFPNRQVDVNIPVTVMQQVKTKVIKQTPAKSISIKSGSSTIPSVTTPKEKGVWVWESAFQMTSARMNYLVRSIAENNFTVIYLSIDDHLPVDLLQEGENKDTHMKRYNDALERFITLAHAQNISVDAVSGAPDWAKPALRYQPQLLFRFVKRYNATHENKLRGIQYDIEPYLLPEYNQNKEAVLADYVSFVDDMAMLGEDSALKLTFVIPHFFDKQAALTPQVTFAGQTYFVFTHMLHSLSRMAGSQIIVMAYRDKAEGGNGAISLAGGEVEEASSMTTGDTTIVIAEETGNVSPEYVTFFHTSQSYMNDEMMKINTAFIGSRAYRGIAINHITPFLLLPK